MGCAGLSLALHMIESGKLAGKKVLLIDKDRKQANDRTWCFWEKQSGLFENIVYKKWEKVWIYNNSFSRLLDLAPYRYKLIRGIDFYQYCMNIISRQSNFEIRNEQVREINNEGQLAYAGTGNQRFYADFIFNSILFDKPVLKENEHYLLQHFKGWIIETKKPAFNTGEATLMDFRTEQQHGTTFVYVMPFTGTRALVEYTLFSKELLLQPAYENGLKEYISNILNIENYTVTEEEFGVIPMTNHRFTPVNGRIINIGTAGGQTKASSGYTFRFIQKHSARLVDSLIKKKNPFIPLPAGYSRFHFYDSVLLHILANNKLPGNKIFTRLFRKNKPQQVLRFLDNESSYVEELKIISSLPTMPFLKAAWQQRK
jgi:lycopene beta-cyclase